MRWLNKIDHVLTKFEKLLMIVLFSALILLIALNIISRNLFHVSFQMIPEITPAMVLWLALAGSLLALKQKRHIKLELLLRYLPQPFGFAAGIAVSVFGIVVMGILFEASIEFVKNEIEIFGGRGWLSIIFPLFFAGSVFQYVIWMLNDAISWSKHNKRQG